MNYSFEYIDIILLAMIAGFIILRLRDILGKRTGFEGKISPEIVKEFTNKIQKKELNFSKFKYFSPKVILFTIVSSKIKLL